MFAVYSPEGRNQSLVNTKRTLPLLKTGKSKHAGSEDESGVDQTDFQNELLSSGKRLMPALQKYTTVQQDHSRKIVAQVHELMVHPVVVINSKALLADAMALMQAEQINHLPVVNEKQQLIGLISMNDLLSEIVFERRVQSNRQKSQSVFDVMQQKVITTNAETDIRKVAHVMTEFGSDCLLVMSRLEEVVGIVTRSDIVERLAQEPPVELYV